MPESATNISTFYQDSATYVRTRRLGWLMGGAFFVFALLALGLSVKLWGTYTHVFTFYLKWQDALVVLLWFIAFLMLGGCTLVLRFLYAVHIGSIKGVFSLVDTIEILVRDLSAENLASIFWMLNASFWCFIVVEIGLVPIILIGWTHRITPAPLAFAATFLAILLSLAGIVLSVVFVSFIVIGCFGAVSFWQKLGLVQTYKLNTQTVIRCDGNVVTIIYPDRPESMLDLNALSNSDRVALLALLRERWLASQRLWSFMTDAEQIDPSSLSGALPDTVLVVS